MTQSGGPIAKMSSTILRSDVQTVVATPRPTTLDRLARRAFHSRLRALTRGAITIVDVDRQERFGQTGANCALHATLVVLSPRFYRQIVFGGSVGAADAYIQGLWSCDDLTVLVRIFVLNRALLDGMERGLARCRALFCRLSHALCRNTLGGSRRNIAAHYDVGNEFFSFVLDATMMYSCAIFEHPYSSLWEASIAKNDRICRKLRLSPDDHLLEIGTGWGGFATQAARDFGSRVTTTTISQRQYEYTVQRVNEAGLNDRVTVLLKDYRELRALPNRFDKIVSIEMIEAIGHTFYKTFFKCCSELLKPDGMMLLQTITIEDQRYERSKRSVDFIKRYVFPGSCIPSVTALCNAAARATDMRFFQLEDIGFHYSKTLRLWRERLIGNFDDILALGYSKEFIRMWELYLHYCEGGFIERSISDVQMLFTKPLFRPTSSELHSS